MTARIGAAQPGGNLANDTDLAGNRGHATGSRSFATILRDTIEASHRTSSTLPAGPAATTDAARALALQDEVFRHAERVEIVSRLVDHAVGSVKTLLQTRF